MVQGDIKALIHSWKEANCRVIDVKRQVVASNNTCNVYPLPENCFMFLPKDKAKVKINGEEYYTLGKQLIHAIKGDSLSIQALDFVEVMMVYYDMILPELKNYKSLSRLHHFRSVLTVEDSLHIYKVSKELYKIWQSKTDLTQIRAKALFYTIVHSFLLELKNQHEKREEKDPVYRSICYIKAHYKETISLESLADKLNYSPSHLSLLFKDKTGLSPIAYVTKIRIDKAAELLKETDALIYTISSEVGYQDPHYFSRIFKKVKGFTPGAYRDKYKKSEYNPVGVIRKSIEHRTGLLYSGSDYHSHLFIGGTWHMTDLKHSLALKMMLSSTFFLAACTGGEDESQSVNNQNTADNELLVQQHQFGETVIPDNIERVVSIGLEDMVYKLDLPLAHATLHGEDHYLEEQLFADQIDTSIGRGADFDYEVVLEAQPDLIIMAESPVYDEGVYEDMTKIAPTIFFSRENWREDIVKLGELTDRRAEAELIVDDFEAYLSDAEDTITEAVGDDATVAFIRLQEKMAYVWFPFSEEETDKGYVGLIYDSVGLQPDPYILELMEQHPEEKWGIQLSLEKLPELTADYIFVTAGASGGTQDEYSESWQQLSEIEELQVWQSIPAVQNDHVYQVSAKHWMLAGPYADKMKVDDVINALVD
jgi:iron complex transport system substrate-binding protein